MSKPAPEPTPSRLGEILTEEEELRKFPADAKWNGWTEETLAAYAMSRDRIEDRVAGNVVTEFVRARPPVRIETIKDWNPFKRERK